MKGQGPPGHQSSTGRACRQSGIPQWSGNDRHQTRPTGPVGRDRGVPEVDRLPRHNRRREMMTPFRIQSFLLCVLAISVALPIAESAGREPPAALREFQRSILLRRFDRDRDGKLDEREKRALRDSFDGIDVPMLPDKPFEYTTVELPAHVNRASQARPLRPADGGAGHCRRAERDSRPPAVGSGLRIACLGLARPCSRNRRSQLVCQSGRGSVPCTCDRSS